MYNILLEKIATEIIENCLIYQYKNGVKHDDFGVIDKLETNQFKKPGWYLYTDKKKSTEIKTPEQFIIDALSHFDQIEHNPIQNLIDIDGTNDPEKITEFNQIIKPSLIATGFAYSEKHERDQWGIYIIHRYLVITFSLDVTVHESIRSSRNHAGCKKTSNDFDMLCSEHEFDIITDNNAFYNMSAVDLPIVESWYAGMKNPHLDKNYRKLTTYNEVDYTIQAGFLYQPLKTTHRMKELKDEWKYYCNKNCGAVQNIMCNTPDVSQMILIISKDLVDQFWELALSGKKIS